MPRSNTYSVVVTFILGADKHTHEYRIRAPSEVRARGMAVDRLWRDWGADKLPHPFMYAGKKRPPAHISTFAWKE